MAIGKIRAIIIIALFTSSASIPVIMEFSVVPMLNMLTYIDQFIDYDENGDIIIKFDALLSAIQRIECLEDESNENQTTLQLTLNITNTDPFEFDILIPGIDMTIYWKAGIPYELEKDTILNWTNQAIGAADPHPEPDYPARRWTRVMGLQIDATRVKPGLANQQSLKIKLILYNDAPVGGSLGQKSNALGQMIGTIFRTMSTEDPKTGEALMHISGAASLDIPISIPLSIPLGLDLSSFLNITELLSGLGGEDGGGGGGPAAPNLFELLFDVPLNIFDVQNYNDSNQNFIRDATQYPNGSFVLDSENRKQWTEELYQNGAISAYIFMDLVNQLGMHNLNITLLKSSHNPDDANVSRTWEPWVGAGPQDKNTITNQIFLYLPNSSSLIDSDWADRIFGLFGFTYDQLIGTTADSPAQLEDGEVIAGGTMRLTGDLRQNSNFSVGDGIGALISQAVEGVLPVGLFGSIDLMLNEMPLSICLDMPLDLNLSSLLGSMMGGEEEAEGSGDIFSMLMDYIGLDTILLNGLAYDTFGSVLQLNFSTDLDMFLPYGIYMPSEPTYNATSGEYEPYIGIAGGPLQIYIDGHPEDWENYSAAAQADWKKQNLLMNFTSLDSPTLKESMAKLMATIGSSGYYDPDTGEGGLGDGIAYVFDDDTESNGDYGNLLEYLSDNGELPNSEEDKSSFLLQEDQFKLALTEIVPDFGEGAMTLMENIGVDPLFLEYINNSIPHDNWKNVFQDLLSIRQLLDIIYQDGPANDLFDYLTDANITRNETAQVIDGQTLQLSLWGLKDILAIYNTTSYNWLAGHTPVFWENGTIYVDTTSADFFNESGSIQVEYIANKLGLFDLSNLIGAILNMTLGTGDGGSGGGGVSSDILGDILTYLPGTLDAMGIDFDKLAPDLISYLRANISRPEPLGYGIKPFEMMDVAFGAMGGSGGDASDLLGGISSDLIDQIMEEVVMRFIEQADPFQLMYELMGDLTPVIDYLDRSQVFSREVLIPLIASLFPSGSELQGVGEEGLDISGIVDIIMPLITEMLMGGSDAAFDHEALNPFAWLTAPEAIERHDITKQAEWDDLNNSGYSIYPVGFYNYTPDYPKYDYLRLMSNLTLGLLMSGFDASDLWEIINMLGIMDMGGDGGAADEALAGVDDLLPLAGVFVPPTEWLSFFRELGIWSSWSGEMSLGLSIFGLGPWELGGILGQLLNLEKFLATGYAYGMLGLLDDWLFGFPLCVLENQSYGNPYMYVPGYDSAHNTGMYRDMVYGSTSCDNWGWVPLGWDPGGFWPNGYPSTFGNYFEEGMFPGGSGYGDPANNYTPYGGADYAKSFLTKLISTVPVEIDVPLPYFEFDMSLLGFIDFYMFFAMQLNFFIRLEGNPSQLMSIFEEQGVPLMGMAGHFTGGDLAALVTDMIGSLTGGDADGGGSNDTFVFPDLDLVILLESFLNSNVEILHYFKYLVDPEFMKASEWYIDSGYVDAFGNTSAKTLIWDNDPDIPGDQDEIPDEYPWYRFEIPVYNQDPSLVDVGPGYSPTASSRTPDLVDYLTPAGPPGSGLWVETDDGIPDGLQHYWYDTPYAYANSTVWETDPWVNIDPYFWNDVPGGDGYYHYWVGPTEYIWGDDAGEQVPLVQVADGQGVSWSAWEGTGIPSLYYVPPGTTPGIVGSATYYPIPENDGSVGSYPNLWNSFNITLTQTDFRFGYWDTEYDEVLGKDVTYLNTEPFYDLLSYAFYPQLGDLLNMFDLSTLFESTGASAAIGDIASSMGVDYYHYINYDDVFSQFGQDQIQSPLSSIIVPFGMLQWLWDGAGQAYNGTQLVPNIEPYTIPDLQGALDWLANRGFTLDFMLTNLGTITDLLATEVEGGGETSDVLSDMFSTEAITNMINAIEDYLIQIVAQNNLTKATKIALNIMNDLASSLDIYPVKALRGALNYLMPRLSDDGNGGGSALDANQLDLGTFLEESGLLDIIFENTSKLSDLKFTLSIHESTIDLYLFGQLIEGVPLDLEFELDLATLFGGEDDGAGGGDGDPSDFMSELPIAFPEGGFPYIELSTFNGPFDIEFHLWNTSRVGGKTNVDNTNVTIGEVWYNDTTEVYYLNRTQSGDEADAGTSGWINPRTYVRPIQLISDGSGLVQYSSFIEEDNFGWVDPYIYIHVEEPSAFASGTFYWWNVTGYPLQRTLAGNRPPYQARWVDDGTEILVQSLNTLPADSIDIDNDAYWEIFARVEIDGPSMPTHDVVYVEMGSVSGILATNSTLPPIGYQVEVNASHTETVARWGITAATDNTAYILEQEITPTGRAVTYPTISEIITGFYLETNNWDDDSIYELRVDYWNLTGDYLNLYTYNLPTQAGPDSINSVYAGASVAPWTILGSWGLDFDLSPTRSAESYGDYRYGVLDIDAANFMNKTIEHVTVRINVTNDPYDAGATEWITSAITDNFQYNVPSVDTNYYFHQDMVAGNLIIQGVDATLNSMDATEAWFNYTVPIGVSSFLNEIEWDIYAHEGVANGGNIAEVILTYHNDTDDQDYEFMHLTDEGGTSNGFINDWGDQRTSQGGWAPISWDLYLTSRGHDATPFYPSLESVSSVTISVMIEEPGAPPNDGIGFRSGERIYNTSVLVRFKFYPFVDDWGLSGIEIPEGFFCDFDVEIRMYDPVNGIAALTAAYYPEVNVSYTMFGPLQHDLTIDEPVYAQKILLYLEAWDSLVRLGGRNGDILFKDNQSSGTQRLVFLDTMPTLNTSIDVVDTEAKAYINVTINAEQTLRNYYLDMAISPAASYAGRPYTGNYRFSVVSYFNDLTPNTDVMQKIGAYASKKVLNETPEEFPNNLRVGMVDLEAYAKPYYILYTLTFDLSPEFIIFDASETFTFKAVWEKAEGTYEVRPVIDKMETSESSINIVYIN